MTVTSAVRKNQITAALGQTVFTGAFEILAEGDVKVYQRIAGSTADDSTDLLTLTTEYTVAGVGVDGGFTVTLVTGAALNDIVTLVGNKAKQRTSDYVTNGQFTSASTNSDLDTQLIFSQDNDRDERIQSVYYYYSAVVANKDRFLPVLSASEYWQMNSGGTGIQAVTLEANANVNTLRSELASQTALAPGSDLIGVYTNEVTGATLTAYLNAVEPPISDNLAIIKNAADGSKKIKFDASTITPATTRTITMPDNNVDLTNVAQATTAVRGTAEIATNAEILALANDLNLITPKGLGDNLFAVLTTVLNANNSLATNGYQKFGNLIVQWGVTASIVNAAAAVTITLPIAFPNTHFVTLLTPVSNNTYAQAVVKALPSFNIELHGPGGNSTVYFISIGN